MSGLVESSADARSKTIGQNFRCRAWVNFNGTGTVAIRGSGNVSSVDDQGTGLYKVNYTTSMPDANYSATAIAQRSDYDNSDFLVAIQGNAATDWHVNSMAVGTQHANNNTMSDALSVGIAIFR